MCNNCYKNTHTHTNSKASIEKKKKHKRMMKKGRTLPGLDINSTEAIMNDMVVGLSKM